MYTRDHSVGVGNGSVDRHCHRYGCSVLSYDVCQCGSRSHCSPAARTCNRQYSVVSRYNFHGSQSAVGRHVELQPGICGHHQQFRVGYGSVRRAGCCYLYTHVHVGAQPGVGACACRTYNGQCAGLSRIQSTPKQHCARWHVDLFAIIGCHREPGRHTCVHSARHGYCELYQYLQRCFCNSHRQCNAPAYSG